MLRFQICCRDGLNSKLSRKCGSNSSRKISAQKLPHKKLLSFVTVTIALGGARVFPVMVMNKLINKKSFGAIDWLIAFMLCFGCIIFVFANETSNAEILGQVDDETDAFGSHNLSELYL